MIPLRGNRLSVDLGSGAIKRERTPEGIGGRSWNSVTLLEEIPAGVDPLGPENVLCISVGTLTGSELYPSCRVIASAKSPLTGYLGDSGARGFFAPELRWAGHDQIVSTEAIDEFAARLRTGSHLIVPGARHELLMEQDRFRGQVLAAFDAFVPGTPAFG